MKILGSRRIRMQILSRMLSRSRDHYLTEHLLATLSNALSDSLRTEDLLNRFVRGGDPDIALVAAYLLTSSNVKLRGRLTGINPWATPILVSHNYIKKSAISDRIDGILRERYRLTTPLGFSFRKILNRRQYKQALLHLRMAEGGYATNRSLWATQMDNFNQIMLFVIFKSLGMNTTIDSVFASLSSKKLRTKFPNVAAVFEKCHNARKITPIAHAYSIRLGSFARVITIKERELLHKDLKIAYQELVRKI